MHQLPVRRWIIRYTSLLLLPLLTLIIILFSYMSSNLTRQNIELSQNTLQLYISQLQESMDSIERMLITIYDTNASLSNLSVSNDKNQLYMSQIAYSTFLGREQLIFNRFDGLFSIIERDDETIYIDAGQKDAARIKQEFLSLSSQGTLSSVCSMNNWFVHSIDNCYYLMRITKNGTKYCGAWICLQPLADFVNQACSIENSEAVILSSQNLPLSFTSAQAQETISNYNPGESFLSSNNSLKYAVSTSALPNNLLQFYLLVPTNIILRITNQLWILLALILFVEASIACFYYIQIRSRILQPCTSISNAMVQIENDTFLSVDEKSLSEFYQIEHGFNHMKRQIHTLKIEQYEQELREQKIHMQYLFGQIQPHFFLNTLNVLYSFAEIERYDLIQSPVLAMVRYLRYVFNNGSKPVALKDELYHVEDFITIQQIRFPDRITWKKEVDSSLDEIGILPFILQTFVENSIKYGLDADGQNELSIKASIHDGNLEITISDTGKGFSEEQLKQINNPVQDEDSIYRIGIRNSRQRMRMMYGDSSEIIAGNKPEGGAVVTLRFPAIPYKKGEISSHESINR